MSYDPQSISDFFDRYGQREWDRLVSSPAQEVSLYIHSRILERYLPGENPAGGPLRVLEIGAGPGRFTQMMASLGLDLRVLVADISPGQLELNRGFAGRLGFAQIVEDWQVVDIADLARFADGSFDRVVAFGGPFSYVLERRDAALRECLRVLKPGGRLLASVMTMWGSAHHALPRVLDTPPQFNQRITATGDLTPATWPERTTNQMHMFRSAETRAWLEAAGARLLALSASGVLANAWDSALGEIRQDATKWAELLRMELEASAEPGCLDMGMHLIFVVERSLRIGPEA